MPPGQRAVEAPGGGHDDDDDDGEDEHVDNPSSSTPPTTSPSPRPRLADVDTTGAAPWACLFLGSSSGLDTCLQCLSLPAPQAKLPTAVSPARAASRLLLLQCQCQCQCQCQIDCLTALSVSLGQLFLALDPLLAAVTSKFLPALVARPRQGQGCPVSPPRAMPDADGLAIIGSRRSLKDLPPIDTSLQNVPRQPGLRWSRTRPVVPLHHDRLAANASLSTLDNRKSTMSLFHLFSRPKVERARGHHEPGLTALREPKTTTALSPVTATPSSPHKSMQSPSVPPRSRGGPKRQRSQNSANWEPPPLFQAYPQAIKHALLQATNASAEAIIKIQSHRRQYSLLQEKLESKLDMSTIPEDKNDAEMKRVARREKRMSTSSQLGVPELPHKVYVLTTSGHVLQYAGDGPSDRLPEKILQLGRDSAAFACDLIPGKHWVLQVSHATNEEGVVTTQPPKSFLTRLRVGAAAKKTASTLLLVFDSPEEMGAWLSALRKEIDILAGRRSRSDTTGSEDTGPALQKAPSHRYLVHRDSTRFHTERTPPQSPAETPPASNAEWSSAGTSKVRRNASTATNNTGRLASIRQSMEAPSTAPTSASYEHAQLAQLRESSRISVVSNRTSGTSPDTSTAPPSPGRDAPTIPEDEPPQSPLTLKSAVTSPPSSKSNRRSMATRPLSSTGEPASDGPNSRPARNSRFGPSLPGTQPLTVSQTEEQNAHVKQGPSRPLTSRMSFSRPFHTSPYKPLPTIRSSSAPPVKSPDAEQEPASSSDPPPQVRVSTVPAAATVPTGKTTNRQAPINKPGFRRIPVRPSNFVPPRRISSLGPSLPVKVSPELVAKRSTPQLRSHSPGSADHSEELKPAEATRTSVQPAQKPTEQAPLPAIARSGVPEVSIGSSKVRSQSPRKMPITTTQVPASPVLPSSPFPLQPPVPAQQAQPPQTLRRPVSMQIRSQPGAAFLSNRQPVGVSTKGVFGRAASVERSSSSGRPPSTSSNRRPSNPRAASEQGPDGQPRRSVFPRRSMPVMGLPPPAPPPNMPLPPPPSSSPKPDRTAVAV